MGIPDLMRFVARDANGALRRVPQDASKAGVVFDYALVDLTNTLQTLKLQSLVSLLARELRPRVALVLVLDGQRDRQGTSRGHRQFLQQRDADVAVLQITAAVMAEQQGAAASKPGPSAHGGATGMFASKKSRAEGPKASASAGASPRVVVCGREVAGEGDYKLLSIHRRLFEAHHASGKPSPSFLFVSEDSDVLVGAMGGPAPHRVTLATMLHDALHEIHLLDVGLVLRRLYATSGLSAPGHHRAEAGGDAAGGALAAAASVLPTDLNAARDAKKITFGDEDEDADEPAPATREQQAAAAKLAARRAKVLPPQADVQAAGLDFVFLFALVLGSSTTPPITRGATRVDAAACWQHYSSIIAGDAPLRDGRRLDRKATLLRYASPSDESEPDSAVIVDAELLSTILESRFADDRSRVPTAEERKYARDYLKHLVNSTCLLAAGAPADTRPDAGKFTQPPAVSCLTAVLEAHDQRMYEVAFDFTLFPVSSVAGNVGAAAAEPMRRLPAFIDDASARSAQPPHGANVFWPPHETRLASQVAQQAGTTGLRVHSCAVALPLGASPSGLNVPAAVLASKYAASIDSSVYTNVVATSMDAAHQAASGATVADAAPAARVGTANLTFDFDMRRMVPRATAHSDAEGGEDRREAASKAQQAVLAAAGLSVSYFDGDAATAARKAWDEAGQAKRRDREALKRQIAAKAKNPESAKKKADAGNAEADAGKKKSKKRLGKRERKHMAKKAAREAAGGDEAKAAKDAPAPAAAAAAATAAGDSDSE